jgi:hypothetical protein
LTAIFGNSEEDSPDNEKLLHLYWNRNELKKEFAGMRKEQFRLKDKVQQTEGASARLQQKLDHIEDLLIDPEWSRSVAVFYQLRGVALRCESKLARFAEQIKQQREQKLNDKIIGGWNERLAQEASVLGRQLLERQNNIQGLEDQRNSESRRLDALTGLFSFLKRRSITASIDGLTDNIRLAEADEASIQAQLDEIGTRTPPEALGLDISAKRSINFMIIAFAQHLYIQFGDRALVGLVKEASEKSVGSVNYGSENECSEVLKRVRACMEKIDGDAGFAEILQKRAKLVSEKALFHKDDDAVPISGTVATLFKIDRSGLIREADANLLGDNYWRIATTLSR